MTSKNNPSALDPRELCGQLSNCQIENEALGVQVEVLRAHLQSAEQHIACQENKATELSTRLETETKENKLLLKQVEHLTSKLKDERAERLMLTDQLQTERDTHQEELEAQMRSHADRVREDQVKCEMMDLKKRLQEQTSINVKLATQLQAEREVSQALQAESAKLKEELKEQEDKALVALQAIKMLVEEETTGEKVPGKKKKRSVWKRICHSLGLRRKRNERQEESTSTN
ncbi:interactor of constitutive active ROPs 4-like [Thunnus maccoyii]|uniref:interactor of constitutive active ROPs 4-like n=1 Tax=Thunnus maccoyii TaxID=8240 RepID=UPI001C4A7C39|nr:interactor of constitutive active ROPs 4-like [Thunnus maccoyii]XP_042290123.1 interactor of constitutive active ROPs 4-like [Thunnus maccoyii]